MSQDETITRRAGHALDAANFFNDSREHKRPSFLDDTLQCECYYLIL